MKKVLEKSVHVQDCFANSIYVEIKSLIWPTEGTTRTKPQIITNITGRIDTGAKNAATVRKQLHTAEDKLEQVLFVSQPSAVTDEGLPVMAITEELDEEDNIICACSTTPIPTNS
jgi:unconventional prefoldin RPB5 interactor 1